MTRLEDVVSGGGWIDPESAHDLRSRFLLGRAVEAYCLMLPAMNVVGLRDGSEAAFGRGYHVLPIWKDRMDSRAVVPTPNADVIYSMSYLNLRDDGPLVVYAPPHVIGMFTDFYQRTLTDVGASGPDRARGGLYLLVPPDYDGPEPAGYFTVRSSTFNVFLFFRTVLTQGPDGPDTAQAVATAEQTLIYPLGSLPGQRRSMLFPNASGRRLDMMYPTDGSYWQSVKRWVDDEPVAALPMNVRGVLASLGIVKGVPFDPADDVAVALAEAVQLAPRMIFANRLSDAYLARARYYHDRQYMNVWGRRHRRFPDPELHRRRHASRVLPDRLLLGTGDGRRNGRSGIEIPVHDARRRRRVVERCPHLPAAAAAEPARAVVLGGHSVQRDRRHHARNPATAAVDQPVRPARDGRRRVRRAVVRPATTRRCGREELDTVRPGPCRTRRRPALRRRPRLLHRCVETRRSSAHPDLIGPSRSTGGDPSRRQQLALIPSPTSGSERSRLLALEGEGQAGDDEGKEELGQNALAAAPKAGDLALGDVERQGAAGVSPAAQLQGVTSGFD